MRTPNVKLLHKIWCPEKNWFPILCCLYCEHSSPWKQPTLATSRLVSELESERVNFKRKQLNKSIQRKQEILSSATLTQTNFFSAKQETDVSCCFAEFLHAEVKDASIPKKERVVYNLGKIKSFEIVSCLTCEVFCNLSRQKKS